MSTTVGDIAAHLAEIFPEEWAESWDNIGLIVGDPKARIEKVFVTLDADVEAVKRAVELGAQMIVSHHPPFMDTPRKVLRGGDTSVLFEAMNNGVSILSMHTNLDRSPRAAGVLLEAMDLGQGEPLERGVTEMSSITVYVPTDHAESVRSAMLAAGAGRIGEYRGCTFESSGEGAFLSPKDGVSYVGVPGEETRVEEVRLETLCARHSAYRITEAIRQAHPYEEPLVIVNDTEIMRGSVALGRITRLPEKALLSDIVEKVVDVFGCVPRIWGSRDKEILSVATATGSGGSLVATAISAGADVLIAGEVRYHDALSASSAGLAIIEAGHDVTEWPLVQVLGDVVAGIEGIDDSDVHIEGPKQGWWTP